jgi:hypothetical protein
MFILDELAKRSKLWRISNKIQENLDQLLSDSGALQQFSSAA